MKRCGICLAFALIVSGCGSSPLVSPPAQDPVPAAFPAVTVQDGQVEVLGIKGTAFLWRADGESVAVQTDEGVWAISADGTNAVPLVEGDAARLLVHYSDQGLLYIEEQPEQITVARSGAGSPPEVIAAVPKEHVGGTNTPIWFHLTGERLTVIPEGQRAVRVDLAERTAAELGDEAIPVVNGDLALSRGERYLAYKLINRGDAVRILDLETGEVHRTGGEAHVAGVQWSPQEDRWAVRAAEPGSGLPRVVGANTVDGATHIDVGDPQGRVRHLTPPGELVLIAGPFWSPDGRMLAVLAEAEPGSAYGADSVPEGAAQTAARSVWAVDAVTGGWREIGTLERGWLDGWAADGQALRIVLPDGRMLLPVTGGDLVPDPRQDRQPAEEWVPSPDGRYEARVRAGEGSPPALVVRPTARR